MSVISMADDQLITDNVSWSAARREDSIVRAFSEDTAEIPRDD